MKELVLECRKNVKKTHFIHANNSSKLFMQIIHANYSCKLFMQIIHANYSCELFMEIIH